MRATSATDKAASGQELDTIQQEVGHRKGSGVTSRHYIHFEDRQIIEACIFVQRPVRAVEKNGGGFRRRDIGCLARNWQILSSCDGELE